MKNMLMIRSRFILITVLAGLSLFVACGGGAKSGGSGSSTTPPGSGAPPSVSSISVTPSSITVHGDGTQQFTATVTGESNASVTWSVNGVVGGNSTIGTISATGLYTAPDAIPSPNPVEVQATSVAKSSLVAKSTVTVSSALPALTSVSPNSFQTPATFTLTLTGKHFTSGSVVLWGATHLQTTFVSSTQLTANGDQSTTAVVVDVSVLNPDSTVSNVIDVECDPANVASPAVAARYLHQSTWGPTTALMAYTEEVGIKRALNAEFANPITLYNPPTPNMQISDLQGLFFNAALMRNDQLRQRMAFSLSQIMVASSNKVNDVNAFILWQNMLQKDAFGNYYDLLKDVTLSPVMGNYLDMVNNDKPNPAKGTSANENYAREVLQLFSIGLSQLNPDGTQQLDSSGNSIPTYSQDTITNFARAFTGWTYPPSSGSPSFGSSPNYSGPMVPIDSHHDTDAKTLLNGTVIPAGGTAQSDMNAALQNIFNHPNVGPFICKQLIQHLVTSNPSPDYVGRVTAVFNNNGSGVRGDLKAVVTAILLDPEARRGDDPTQVQPTDGHLKEPVLLMLNIMRTMNMTADGDGFDAYAANLKQEPLNPPSVFSFYPPNFVIPNTNLLGPEFDLFNSSTSISRINFINDVIYGSISPNVRIDLSDYLALAPNPDQLVDRLGAVMMGGNMSSDMRTELINAVSAIPDNTHRVQAAIYLIGSSSQFQVEH